MRSAALLQAGQATGGEQQTGLLRPRRAEVQRGSELEKGRSNTWSHRQTTDTAQVCSSAENSGQSEPTMTACGLQGMG